MGNTICSFEGCGAPKFQKGLCAAHYSQQRKGRPLTPILTRLPFEERFWMKVDKTPTYWNWTGCRTRLGYGHVSKDGRPHKAYRVAYEMLVGPIPEGMFLDHICYNPSCVRPDHLRTATPKQNSENLKGARRGTKSGVRGVSLHPSGWLARVGHNGKMYRVGLFDNLEDAERAVKQKRMELFTYNAVDRLDP